MDKFPRRNFLQLLALSAATLAATNSPIKPDYIDQNFSGRKTDSEIPKPEFIEYPLGNLDLTVILTEHTLAASIKNYASITDELDKHNLIIPEYFPPDYEPEIDELPLLRENIKNNYRDKNALFDHIEYYLAKREDDLEVRVLDPAYSGSAVLLRLENNWPFAFNTAILDASLIEGVINRHKNVNSNDNFALEKDFMSLFGGGLATLIGAMITQSSTYGTETDLRRVFIAQGLKQFGKMVRPGTKAALIYPSGHWNGDYHNGGIGIKHFLENDILRETFYKEFERFRDARYYKDLYQTRSFTLKNHSWIQNPGFELQ